LATLSFREIRKAIWFHIDGLREEGVEVPKAVSVAEHEEA
jgi:predicted RNase H-like HicB family nuclease